MDRRTTDPAGETSDARVDRIGTDLPSDDGTPTHLQYGLLLFGVLLFAGGLVVALGGLPVDLSLAGNTTDGAPDTATPAATTDPGGDETPTARSGATTRSPTPTAASTPTPTPSPTATPTATDDGGLFGGGGGDTDTQTASPSPTPTSQPPTRSPIPTTSTPTPTTTTSSPTPTATASSPTSTTGSPTATTGSPTATTTTSSTTNSYASPALQFFDLFVDWLR